MPLHGCYYSSFKIYFSIFSCLESLVGSFTWRFHHVVITGEKRGCVTGAGRPPTVARLLRYMSICGLHLALLFFCLCSLKKAQ